MNFNFNQVFPFNFLRSCSTLSNRTRSNRYSKQHSKSNSRLKIQENKWLNKVDQVRNENKQIEDLKTLKVQYNITEDNQYEILNKELIPLSLINYETQVKIKKRRLELFLNQFVSLISKYKSTVILDSEGHPCVFNDLVEAECREEYRSQDNFVINLDVNKSIAVGFILGKFNTGLTVIRPAKFLSCKKSHRLLAEKFETYLKEKSRLKVVLDFKSHHGNWQEFFVRSNQNGEHQCLAILNDQNLSDEAIKEESSLLKEYFGSILKEFNIKSFDLELINTDKNPKSELAIREKSRLVNVFGDSYLPFEFNNITYKISVKSLLPQNLEVYEKLINLIVENMDLVKKQNLIIVNPFGGLGLLDLSRLVSNLFVINKDEQLLNSCKDSLKDFDKVKNMHFSHGNALKSLFKILDNNRQEISIIIKQEDLSPQIISELRLNRRVSKIALIATKPKESLLKNWAQLCLDNVNDNNVGEPFNFISSTPLDTHPHSNIYTILCIFEKIVN